MKRVSRNSDLDTTILDLKRLDLHCFEIEYKTIQNLTKNPSTSPSVLLKLLNSASEIDESSHLVLKGNCFLHDNLP